MAELKKKVLDFGSVSVTANGVKTNGQLLNELYALIDMSKLTGQSYLTNDGRNHAPFISYNTQNEIFFATAGIYDGSPNISQYTLRNSGSTYEHIYSNTNHSYTNEIASNGVVIAIHY